MGAIRPGISGLRPPTRICDESPLHQGLYPSFVFVYTVLARVSTQHAVDGAAPHGLRRARRMQARSSDPARIARPPEMSELGRSASWIASTRSDGA